MFFDGMGNLLFCGKPRTGKTCAAVLAAVTDPLSEGVAVVGSTGLSQSSVDLVRDAFELERIPTAFLPQPYLLLDDAYRGWSWFVDESQQFFPARQSMKINPDNLRIFYEYGKRCARIYQTTQMVRNLDLVPSGFSDTVLRATGLVPHMLSGGDWPRPMVRSWRPELPMRCSFRERMLFDRLTFSKVQIELEFVDAELMRKQTTLQNELGELEVAGESKMRVPFLQFVADAYDSGQLVK